MLWPVSPDDGKQTKTEFVLFFRLHRDTDSLQDRTRHVFFALFPWKVCDSLYSSRLSFALLKILLKLIHIDGLTKLHLLPYIIWDKQEIKFVFLAAHSEGKHTVRDVKKNH